MSDPEQVVDKNDEDAFKPFRIESAPWREHSEGDRFGLRWQPLSRFAGGTHLGVEICELAPGKQAYPAHFHMLEEEHMLILDGSATLLLGKKAYEVTAGDYVCFPAGQQVGHALVNNGSEVCRYLMVGEDRREEVVVYTDSNKVGVRALGARFPMERTMDYWEGEDT